MGNQNLEKEGQRPTLRKKNNKGQTTMLYQLCPEIECFWNVIIIPVRAELTHSSNKEK
jgi:hypothetical protein